MKKRAYYLQIKKNFNVKKRKLRYLRKMMLKAGLRGVKNETK